MGDALYTGNTTMLLVISFIQHTVVRVRAAVYCFTNISYEPLVFLISCTKFSVFVRNFVGNIQAKNF